LNSKLKPIHGLIVFVIAIVLLFTVCSALQAYFGIVGLAFTELIILITAIIPVLIIKEDFSNVFPMKLPPIKSFFGGFLLYTGTRMLSAPISLILTALFPSANEVVESLVSVGTSVSPFYSIIFMAILPAICEEMLVRGFILSSIKKINNNALTVIIIGLLFGAMHLDPYRFLPTAMLGAVFAFIAIATNSLLLPMIFHFMNNISSVISMYTLTSDSNQPLSSVSFPLFSPIMLGYIMIYLALAIILFYFGYTIIKSKPRKFNISAILTIICIISIVAGYLIISFDSSETILSVNRVLNIKDPYEESQSFNVEKSGAYVFSASTSGPNVDYTLRLTKGDEVIYEVSDTGMLAETQYFELSPGEYTFTILASPKEGSLSRTMIIYSSIDHFKYQVVPETSAVEESQQI